MDDKSLLLLLGHKEAQCRAEEAEWSSQAAGPHSQTATAHIPSFKWPAEPMGASGPKMAEVRQFRQFPHPPGPVHIWPDDARALGVVGRSVVAVVVERLVTPARLPIVHVGSGSGHHPPSVGGVLRRGGVALALCVGGQHDLPLVLYPDHPSATSASVQELGAQVDDRVVGAGSPHGGEEGLALVPVGVREAHGSLLLQRRLLGGGQQAGVHLSFRPAIGHNEGVVGLRAPPLAAAGSRHAHHRPAAALPQHALLFVTFASGAVGSGAPRVAVAVTHDPADGEPGEDGSGGEG
ncbi:hypothetical protein F7725_027471 [Dissostichus mawsoni]|uniref:Uncharacterized protein n=1 Tax=Dissostichus mawsoni TaxID=36200 RepID=A0A7J5XDI7_DISMA|nr:hypothetical protein F7725_027471 [Dissostichus mawsoni]